MDESLFEVINVQQHVDGIELNIHMELVQDVDRYVVFRGWFDVEGRPEGTHVARGQPHVTRSTDFLSLLPKFFVILAVEFVRQYTQVSQNGQCPVCDLADRK